jgi:micrococcal nuclease
MRAAAVLLVLFASCSSVRATAPTPASPTLPPATAAARIAPATGPAWPPVPPRAVHAHVTRVVDGDTIVLDGIDIGYADSRGRPGRHARLIGVDTPEVFGRAGCFGSEASAFTKRELSGRDVLVDFDVDPVDRYGRALVYVWTTDGTLFNGKLAEDGYGLQLTVPPDVRYAELFTNYVRDARAARCGLWSSCAN